MRAPTMSPALSRRMHAVSHRSERRRDSMLGTALTPSCSVMILGGSCCGAGACDTELAPLHCSMRARKLSVVRTNTDAPELSFSFKLSLKLSTSVSIAIALYAGVQGPSRQVACAGRRGNKQKIETVHSVGKFAFARQNSALDRSTRWPPDCALRLPLLGNGRAKWVASRKSACYSPAGNVAQHPWRSSTPGKPR